MKTSKELYRTPTQTTRDPSLPQLVNCVIPKPDGTLLDIGCGDGFKTKIFWEATQTKTAWGVDFNPDKLEEARKVGVQTVEADLDIDLPLAFPSRFFDLIICSEVIEHVYSPDALLDEMVRLLKDDGYILLTTPNLASWKNRLALLLGWQPFASEISTRDRLRKSICESWASFRSHPSLYPARLVRYDLCSRFEAGAYPWPLRPITTTECFGNIVSIRRLPLHEIPVPGRPPCYSSGKT